MTSKKETMAALLDSLAEDCSGAILAFEGRGGGGQRTSYHGPFANLTPGSINDLRFWLRAILKVTTMPDDHDPEREKANEFLVQLHDMTKRAEEAEEKFKQLEQSYVRTVLRHSPPLIPPTQETWPDELWEWALRYGYAVEEATREAHAGGLKQPPGYIYMRPLLAKVGPPPLDPKTLEEASVGRDFPHAVMAENAYDELVQERDMYKQRLELLIKRVRAVVEDTIAKSDWTAFNALVKHIVESPENG